jgi:integrase
MNRFEVTPATVALARGAITPNTCDQYRSLQNQLTATYYPAEHRYLDVTIQDFTIFLTLEAGQELRHNYVDRLRSAVMHRYTVHGVPAPEAQVKFMAKCIEGYKRKNPEDPSVKGAIEAREFELFQKHLVEKNVDDETFGGIVFQWGFGLRGGQVSSLAPKHFHRDSKQGWIYIGPRHKDGSMIGDTVTPEMHSLAPQVRHIVTHALEGAESGDPNQPLFPGYSVRKVTALLKEARDRFKWPKELKWSGSHCLRHGALAQARAEGGLEAVGARGAHISEQMKVHYSLSNAERLALVRAFAGRKHPPAVAVRKAANKKKAKKNTKK